MKRLALSVTLLTIASAILLQPPLKSWDMRSAPHWPSDRSSVSCEAPQARSSVVELKPWIMTLEHPSSGHRLSLDMWRLGVAAPGNPVASQFFDVRRFPNQQWISLTSTDGTRLPMDAYRDGYTVNGPMNVTGRLLVRWLMSGPVEGGRHTPEAFSPNVELKPWIMTLEHPRSGHRLFLDTWRLSVRPPGATSMSSFYDLRTYPKGNGSFSS